MQVMDSYGEWWRVHMEWWLVGAYGVVRCISSGGGCTWSGGGRMEWWCVHMEWWRVQMWCGE